MMDLEKFEYYLNTLLPGSLTEYVGNRTVEPVNDIRLFNKFCDFFFSNMNVKTMMRTSFERFLIQATRESFSLGFISVIQVSDMGFGIETKPDEFLDEIIDLVKTLSAWKAAFDEQNIPDIFRISAKIQVAQDGMLMSFREELKHEGYIKLYMQYYYFMGVMFGKRIKNSRVD